MIEFVTILALVAVVAVAFQLAALRREQQAQAVILNDAVGAILRSVAMLMIAAAQQENKP